MRTDTVPSEHRSMPFAWTRVRLHAPGVSFVRVCVSRLATGGYAMEAYDEYGRPVLSADSIVLRKISQETLQIIHGTDHEELFHIEWSAVAPGEPAASSMSPENWVTLGEYEPPHTGAGVHADHRKLASYPDLKFLIDTIDGGGPVPEAVLIYFGADELAGQEPLSVSRQILERGLLLLQEWLAETRLQGSRLVFMTERAMAAGSDEGTVDLASAPLWGLVRSAQSENPGWFMLADIDDSEDQLSALALAIDAGESQVALREGEVLAPRLRRMVTEHGEIAGIGQDAVGQPEPDGEEIVGAEQATGGQADPVDRNRTVSEIGLSTSGLPGSVLITGGTGSIGAALAKHLVDSHGVRSVVLASRQGPLAPGADSLEAELIELGAQACIVACDVSDREQLAELIASIPIEYPLSAVVHAAGALDDGVIESMTPERIDRVLKPKLDAAWHLHELTKELDLSAFILFSSSNGTIGGPAQSNYAAANVFLDALATHRREQGLCGVSMAWGLWETDEGMTGNLTAADRARMERAGVLPLSFEEGMRLFDVAYVAGEPLMIPARLNMATLRAQARTGVMTPLLRDLIRIPTHGQAEGARESLARRLASTPENARKRVVLDLVRAEVAAVLGHPSPDAIDAHRAFSELGFDSLTAIELRNKLAAASGVQLPATLAFDYPSPTALSDFLLEQVSPEIGPRVESAPDDVAIRSAFASIPLARLRDAGVMDTLMQLAGLADGAVDRAEGDTTDQLDEMDVESLVQMSLGSSADSDAVGESVESG
jgi:NAD(P)-dependent dehydrogenase (short-subunit alcohol dehydrogenase family)/acyl carrier protein